MMPMIICLLLVWGYIIGPCGSITLKSEGIDNGEWVLKERSTATIVCTIYPFSGILMWYFNSSMVAECKFQYCYQISTGDGTFLFGFDTTKGNFELSITSVDKKKHDAQIFECFDGTNTSNVTVKVTDAPDITIKENDVFIENETNNSHRMSIAALVLSCCNYFLTIVLGVICWKLHQSQKETMNSSSSKDGMNKTRTLHCTEAGTKKQSHFSSSASTAEFLKPTDTNYLQPNHNKYDQAEKGTAIRESKQDMATLDVKTNTAKRESEKDTTTRKGEKDTAKCDATYDSEKDMATPDGEIDTTTRDGEQDSATPDGVKVDVTPNGKKKRATCEDKIDTVKRVSEKDTATHDDETFSAKPDGEKYMGKRAGEKDRASRDAIRDSEKDSVIPDGKNDTDTRGAEKDSVTQDDKKDSATRNIPDGKNDTDTPGAEED